MLPYRRALLAVSVLLVGGSLSATLAYGWRLRSDHFRRGMEQRLSAFFELPCDIGAIRPLTFSSRAFEQVSVWLADRRARAFQCERSVWYERHEGGEEIHDLDLYRGALSFAADLWRRDDYSRVLQSGLGHDFGALRIGEVRLHDFQVDYRHTALRLACKDVSGTVSLTGKPGGTIHLIAGELNGYRPPEPVQVTAHFASDHGVTIQDLVLTLPEVPLAAVGLDATAFVPATRGRFAGRIEYHESATGPVGIVSGRLSEASLAELTHGVPSGPIRGSLDVAIDQARIENHSMTQLIGRGEIRGLMLGDLAVLLDRPGLTGTADISVGALNTSDGRINRLVLDGRLDDVPVEALCSLLGSGRATGRLAVTINALRIRGDVIEWADIEIGAVPPPGLQAGTIDRELLLGGVQRALNFTWPESVPQSILPDSIEYSRLGMRWRVKNNRLRVLGTHGIRGDTILTLRLFGHEFGVVHSLRGEIDLTPYLARLKARMATERPLWPHGAPGWYRPATRESGNPPTTFPHVPTS